MRISIARRAVTGRAGKMSYPGVVKVMSTNTLKWDALQDY
jgi:hypothetical protein